MPRRPQQPCRARGCTTRHRNKHGYCDDHIALATGWRRSHQHTNANKEGYGKEWRRLRIEILIRDDYLCQECMRNGIITAATDVDHITSKANGGTDHPTNLQSLCNPCHKAKTIAERNGGGSKVQSL
ncbi:HNH endonuclease signature motif containing protein [Saccharospirillum sp. MSK14-1]|uniref:HNH endonuclease n=1 Tax=Saccharospirillum sp. MSK14-1 TaxID=1897632 RepID=UPI000D3B67FA